MRFITLLLTMTLLLSSFTAVEAAKKEDKIKHPLQVMKATIEKGQSSVTHSVQGRCTIWLKNISNAAVKNIKVTLKLREGSREIRSLDKEVENLDAGKRVFLNYKWEDYDDRKLSPQIWVTYDGDDGKPIKFQTAPPVW